MQQRLHEVFPQVLHYVLFFSLVFGPPLASWAATERDAGTATPQPSKAGALLLVDGTQQETLIAGEQASYRLALKNAQDDVSALRVWRADAPWDAEDPHACIQVLAGGEVLSHSAEAALEMSPRDDGIIELVIAADADCGWLEDDRVRAVPISYEWVEDASEAPAAQRIELPYVLTNQSELPEDMELPVYAGGTRGQLLWTVRKQSRVPQRYRFTLETERSTTPLPACLRVDWADNDDATEGQPLSVDLGGDADEQTLRVVAHAAKGCAAHRYTFPVRVERVTDDGSSVPTTTMRAVHIEVKASKGGGAWIALFIGLGVVIITTFLVRRRED